MFDWNDLKYFLAVARCESTLAAGRAMGLSQSTVQRRLVELERRIGRPLVTRHPAGYRLTEFGLAMLPHAQAVERQVEAFSRQVEEMRRASAGVIRLTCPEPIVLRITRSELLDRFHARHPDIRVEFVISDRYVDLAKGEADVALRSGDTDGDLVGRKIADSLWAIYASKDFVARHGKPSRIEEIESYPLVGFEESMSSHRVSTWLAAVAPNGRIVARNTSVLGLVYAVKAGVGLAPLPTAIGDGEPDLERLLGPVPELARSWRLLTRPDLRQTARISAFFDFITGEIPNLRPILTG
ncbi:LysR family transcriptional regulator [Alsobacter sp. SYSU BS001988]